MDNLSKRPISPTLKKMQIGAIEVFPKIQYRSLNTVIGALKIELDFRFTKEIKENCILVKRTA